MYGESERLAKQKERHQPGTYAYREVHGQGIPGLRGYIRKRSWFLKKCREIIRMKLLKVDEEITQLEEELNAKR